MFPTGSPPASPASSTSPAAPLFRLAFYAHERDPLPRHREVDEAKLVELLTTHIRRPSKEGVAWSPAQIGPCPPSCRNEGTNRFKCGGGKEHRHERNVLSHALVVFDIDHAKEADVEALLSRVKDLGLKAVVHSSFSHCAGGPDDCCLRLILFPSRLILPEEVKKVLEALATALEFGSLIDPATKDLSRLYYLPSCPREGEGPEPVAGFFPGNEFDVDPLLSPALAPSPAPGPSTAAPAPPATSIDVTALRDQLLSAKARVKEEDAKALLGRVLAGEPLAAVGNHDTSLHRLCRLCATYLFQNGKPVPFAAVLAVAETSLRRMGWEDGWEHLVATLEEKYERAVADTVAYREKRAKQSEGLRQLARENEKDKTSDPLAAASAEDGRYTEDALKTWGLADDEWVIQKRDSYFVFSNGEYVSRDKSELPNCIHKDLARSPLQLTIDNGKGGERELTPSEIVRVYGTVAKRVASSLELARSYYDRKTGVFNEAVAPLRRLEPEYDARVDRWLRLLGGKDAEKLLDWVATVTQVSRQTCAVYIWGPPSIGKNIFALGLARLWTVDAPPTLEQAFSNFNSAIAGCPLIFADEKLPERKNINADLRALLGTSSRSLQRKFQADASLSGAVRLIIGANNPDLIRQAEDMTKDELDATAERVLYIEANSDPAKYLIEISGDGPPIGESWRRDDVLAKHALWLKENRKVVQTGRFLVSGHRQKAHDRMAVNSGVGKQVCEVIAKQIVSSKPLPPVLKDHFLFGHGQILVNVRAIETLWDNHISTPDKFSTDRLAKALAAISFDQRTVKTNGKQIRFSRVRAEQVYQWADDTGAVDPDDLHKAIDGAEPQVAAILDNQSIPYTKTAGAA